MAQPETDPATIAGPVLVLMLLGGWILFQFGYRRAVMDRARKDYKSTKAALPDLRKGFWTAVGRLLKIGVVVAIAYIALVAWNISEARR